MKDAKFLITGATGFVGACLTRFLASKNKKVNILVRNKKLNWRLNDIASKLTIFESDLTNPSLSKVINRIKPDVIFHLAAYGTLPHQVDVNQMININIRGTLNLINAVKKHKFKLFINTGSSSEYGVKPQPMQESDLSLPINDYGITKAAATMFCVKIAQTEKLPIITFRLFSPYGYFEEKNRLIPSTILSILNRKAVKLTSSDSVRDFIFIDDVISAYMKAIEIESAPGEIFNIGSGKETNIGKIIKIILKDVDYEVKINWGAVQKQKRQVEPHHWQANITKAKRILGWQPQNDLYTGLTKTFDWFKNNKNLYEN